MAKLFGKGEETEDDGDMVVLDEGNMETADEAEATEEPEKRKRAPSQKTVLTGEIMTYIKENGDDLPEALTSKVKEIEELSIKRGKRPGMGNTVGAQMRVLIQEKGSVTEDELFAQFRIGRLEAKRKFAGMHRIPKNTADYLWVSFALDEEANTGTYTLDGTGEDAPDGFDA